MINIAIDILEEYGNSENFQNSVLSNLVYSKERSDIFNEIASNHKYEFVVYIIEGECSMAEEYIDHVNNILYVIMGELAWPII